MVSVAEAMGRVVAATEQNFEGGVGKSEMSNIFFSNIFNYHLENELCAINF